MDTALKKVLIVEDDPVIADDISSLFQSQGFEVIDVAHNSVDATNVLTKKKSDIDMLDVLLGPGMFSTDKPKTKRRKYHLSYVFLTSYDDEDTFQTTGQLAPSYGHLTKPFQDRPLLTTIKVALANFQPNQRTLKLEKDEVEKTIGQDLTSKEFDILCGLIDGLTYKQLAEKHFVSGNTIKYHASNIYNKCNIKRRSELVARLFNN